jgi:TRAP transporter TAXI family solute receptor
VPEDTAYQMTKLLFENLDHLAAAHAAAKAIDISRALDGMPLDLHPGAERYYREAGVLN